MQKTSEKYKHMPALGPFPRYIWIHPATPPDDLDRVHYNIWKRTQSLPDGLRPRNPSLKTIKTKKDASKERVQNVTNEKDDISRMVEQEYMNLILENFTECFNSMSINESIETEALQKKAQTQAIERFIKSLLVKKEDNPGKILSTKVKKGMSQNKFVVKSKEKSTKQDNCSIEFSKIEACKLLAQYPVKAAEAQTTTNRTNSVNDSDLKTHPITFGSRPDKSTTQSPLKDNRQRLSVFSKLDSKMDSPKQFKSFPPGFAPIPSAHNIPGMITGTSAPPGYMFIMPSSSMVASTMNHLYYRNFRPMVPNQHFIGQHQIHQVNPQQFIHPFTRVPGVLQHTNYFRYIRPNFPFHQRTATKPIANSTDLPSKAGDGPQLNPGRKAL